MTEIKVYPVDALTQFSIDTSTGKALIQFRQGGTDAALECNVADAETMARAIAATILRFARERGVAVARDCAGFELHANLDGASLVLSDSLTTESIHLSESQLQELYDRAGTILAGAGSQPMQ